MMLEYKCHLRLWIGRYIYIICTLTKNNFKLLNYKETDTSHLTENDYVKCLEHYNFCVPHLIRKIHFNPKKPGGGGGMCPQHFQRLAVLRTMELGVSNLHVNSFFHV